MVVNATFDRAPSSFPRATGAVHGPAATEALARTCRPSVEISIASPVGARASLSVAPHPACASSTADQAPPAESRRARTRAGLVSVQATRALPSAAIVACTPPVVHAVPSSMRTGGVQVRPSASATHVLEEGHGKTTFV
jgi:hypothetical protein